MKSRKSLVLAAFLAAAASTNALAQAVDYIDAKSLATVVKTKAQACPQFRGELRVPLISWGGDMATIFANGNTEVTAPSSIFHKKGLSLRLYREDRFVTQVEDYLSCKTPFLRGTLGMVAMANDVINADPSTAPIVIIHLTWSEGGDVLVVRGNINEPKDLKGKTIALQAYGPHVDYLTTVLRSAGVPLNDIKLKWVRDITENPKDKASTFPAKALRQDKTVDAVFVISPDANALTSGNRIGTGSEDSVKGARSLLSTKTANRIIADVYVVRQDFYKANPQVVENFIHGLLLAQEASANLFAQKSQQKHSYDEFIKASAKMLLDSPDAAADVEGMWADARFVGWKGNVSFFTDQNNPRNLARLTQEVGDAFGPLGLKLITKSVSLTPAALDFNKLRDGIRDTDGVVAPVFKKEVIDQLVRDRQLKDRLGEGQLFSFEINFQPNQQNFSSELYAREFDRVIELMSTYGGALLTIEGHADTLAYLKRKSDPAATPEELSRMKQSARNLTLQRANAVRDALLKYAGERKITLDPTQFSTVGHGFLKPNRTCPLDKDGDITASCAPQSKAEWDAMRRVVFRVVSVEAELTEFETLNVKK